MKVLVTGAAGYIGSVAVEMLVAAGHDVIALDIIHAHPGTAAHDDAKFVATDILDVPEVTHVFEEHRPDAVLHFAALTSVSESLDRPTAYFTTNVAGTCNLLNAMIAHGCRRLILSSSCTVYGRTNHVPATEDLPLKALNPYGASKIMAEQITEWHVRQSGLHAAVLRYFNPAGASARCGEARQEETHLIPLALDVAEGKLSALTIYGTDYPTHDGTCVRDYVHVVDVVTANLRALDVLDTHPHFVVNLGSGKGTSVLEVITAAQRVTGRSIPTRDGPPRLGGVDAPAMYADISRAFQLLGWRPTHNLDSMISSAWIWRQRIHNG